MSFFFFKAGYFNKGITGKTLPYLRDRVRRLFVPYLTWGAIGFVLAFFWLSLFPEGIAKAIGKVQKFDWLENGFIFGNGPLWFLLSFFDFSNTVNEVLSLWLEILTVDTACKLCNLWVRDTCRTA